MTLINQLKILPEKPGCYLYFNAQDKVIYVGKAKNLKKRVNSYFTKVHDSKTTKLVRDIVRLETIVTLNEKESLLLEQNLIKKYKPRYNVVLNDDRKYPYIAITNEKDPQYLYIRNYNPKNKLSFGPFPEGTSARAILRTLERVYPLRRCAGNLGKPCLYYHIEQCSGACFKEVDQAYYDQQLKNVQNFFMGQTNDLKEKLEQKMFQAADNLQFEESQRIKDIITNMTFTTTKQEVDLNDEINRDVFNWFLFEEYLCLVVLFYRNGKLNLKTTEVIKMDGQDIFELFESFVLQIYAKNILPDYILIPKAYQNGGLITMFGDKIVYPNEPISERIMELAFSNAQEHLYQQIHYKNKEVTKVELLMQLQELLGLKEFPYHIEMYDIANILDELVTGAMVVYKNGVASLNDFRKYNIQIDKQGDYHRMHALIKRRYERDLDKPNNFADLIIMDGGIQQVHAAKLALSELQITIPVIGLVKNEKHKTEFILDLKEEKLEIAKNSQLFKFLESLQLRVHNFVIAGFRNKYAKASTKDLLQNKVPGLGPVTIKKLYDKFETVGGIYQAGTEKISMIVKNKTTVERLIKYLADICDKNEK